MTGEKEKLILSYFFSFRNLYLESAISTTPPFQYILLFLSLLFPNSTLSWTFFQLLFSPVAYIWKGFWEHRYLWLHWSQNVFCRHIWALYECLCWSKSGSKIWVKVFSVVSELQSSTSFYYIRERILIINPIGKLSRLHPSDINQLLPHFPDNLVTLTNSLSLSC